MHLVVLQLQMFCTHTHTHTHINNDDEDDDDDKNNNALIIIIIPQFCMPAFFFSFWNEKSADISSRKGEQMNNLSSRNGNTTLKAKKI